MEEAIGRSALRLVKLLLFSMAVLHWAACLFYYSASWQNFGVNTWVYHADDSAQNYVRYLYALYWAVVTMMTVGYGDIVPVSVPEKLVAMAVILVGESFTQFTHCCGICPPSTSHCAPKASPSACFA